MREDPARSVLLEDYAQVDKIQTKYLPWVVQYYAGQAMAHGTRVQGFENDNTLGAPTYDRMWVSSE